MALALYDLLLILISAILLPWYLLRRLFGRRSRRGLRQRFGFYSPQTVAVIKDRPVIWLHAVSVGETRAAIPLIKALRKEWPTHALVVTNVTETGHEVAESLPDIDLCLFFPLDLSLVIHRVLDQLHPSLIVIVETEIWPNLIKSAAARQIPLALVNGRISDRSFPRYLRWKFLLAPLLELVPLFCMQSEVDRERMLALGAHPVSVLSTGNLKFDMPLNVDIADQNQLRSKFRLPVDLPLWICGSTHDGEEAEILNAYRALLGEGWILALILAPRHPPRVGAVAELLTSRNVPYRLRSQLNEETPLLACGEVLLVDTLGELLNLYAASDLVFVGGSFVPVGGHNLLEAALVSRPVLFGPHMHNFRDISQLILNAGAGVQVATTAELVARVRGYLQDLRVAEAQGLAGRELVALHVGATVRTLDQLRLLCRS